MKTKKLNLRDFRYYPLLLIVGAALFFLVNLGALNPFISLAQKITLPLQIGFYRATNGLTNLGATTLEIGGLRTKNAALTVENSTLKAENAKLKKLEEENTSLREQIGTSRRDLKIKIAASVIGSGGFGTKKVLLIDKGKNDKVEVNDLVVVKDILIGKIINVSPKVSSVQLLSDPDSSIPVITESGAEGILEGKFGAEISITNVLQSEELTENEIVFTSGKDNLPRDLIVGEIGKVSKIEKEFFQSAVVSQLVTPEKLELVYLIEN
jgi:rod shape-determining protein MreC